MYDYRILTFVKTAEHKSFSAAADELNLSASAVAKQISSLEKEWKTELFVRKKNRNRPDRGWRIPVSESNFYY